MSGMFTSLSKNEKFQSFESAFLHILLIGSKMDAKGHFQKMKNFKVLKEVTV